MAYFFEEEEAYEFGDREAILIQNFRFWIRKNKANEKHFYDGRTWTYNKVEAFEKLFRFWTKDQVRRLIDSLVKQNVLIKGNYNANPHDRTTWYAFTDEVRFLKEATGTFMSVDLANLPNANGENAKSNWQNNKMELAKPRTPVGKTPNYITDNNTDNNTDLLSSEEEREFFQTFWKEKNYKSGLDTFLLSPSRKKWAKDGLDLYGQAAYWEDGFKKRNPDLYKTVIRKIGITAKNKNREEFLQELLGKIKFCLGREGYSAGQYFIEFEEKDGIVYVTDKRALKYKDLLAKHNIKIELK